MKAKFLLALFLVLFSGSQAQYCTTDTRYTEVQVFDSSEITVGANVQYGIAVDHLGNPDTLLMDLYYPNVLIDTAVRRPFVLLFHGGGFVSGDKQAGDIRDLCVHLALRGFVCASANYRLGFNFTEYGQYKARYRAIQDGHAAMRYVVQNANAVRVDTNWLFVGGQSAGSLLALGMVYADPDELDSISLRYNAVAASAELGGLYTSGNALTNSYTVKGIFNNWGGVAASEVDLDEMLPTIAFHGELDTTVRIDADNSFLHYTLDGSRAIHNTLIASNVCSELTVDTTGGHGIFRNAAAKFRAQRAACFFKSVFCNTCADLYTTDSIPATCSLPVGVAGQDGGEAKVYPNPFTTAFQVAWVDGPCEVTLINSMGQVVHRAVTRHGRVNVDVAPGVYVLRLQDLASQQVVTRRLVRQ